MASGEHHRGFVFLTQAEALQILGFSPHIFPRKRAANTATRAKNFLECTLNFEFNTRRNRALNWKFLGFYAKAFGLKPF